MQLQTKVIQGSTDGPHLLITGGVHGDVAATDDHYLLAHVDLKTLIDVDEELDRPDHSVRFVPGDVQTAPWVAPIARNRASCSKYATTPGASSAASRGRVIPHILILVLVISVAFTRLSGLRERKDQTTAGGRYGIFIRIFHARQVQARGRRRDTAHGPVPGSEPVGDAVSVSTASAVV